ncbi:TonB-dependent receptor [Niabella beijingensis]|uniref:TonB-dependent receptor n=1 Tax=Niabella beijingensis TaxID=2872700 RepID=UPI001CBC57FA|nr:TonB-dependent receptor [Niabella beijingensis]MBZ4191850.1 TonB-dependent receptor [Niabella beijingensis]
MQKFLLFTILLMVAFIARAQQKVVVTGTIVDANNFSLPGASVKLLPGGQHTVTDAYGKFEFLNVAALDKFQIEVSYLGYHTFNKTYPAGSKGNLDVKITLNDTAGTMKEVVIIGDRLSGQARAFNQQKNKANISNIISSDQVGRFPDANLGDALKRVPGITIQNDQGEARNLIIRGLAPNLNSVTLNGDRIPSAEGDNRNVQMDLIPSDMVATVEVNKTLTPDMDADAIGGSVNLITRASPNGQRLSATLAGGLNPIRNTGNYTAGLVYGNRFFHNKLGAVASFSYNNNQFGSDNIEASWKKADDPGKTVYVDELGIRYYNEHRIRHSLDLNLDYTFNPAHKIIASVMHNWRTDRENRFALVYENEPEYDDNDQITGWKGNIIREDKGGTGTDQVKNKRLELQKVTNYALRGEHLLSPKWDMDWSVNYARASEQKVDERYIEFEQEDVTFRTDFANTRHPLITPQNEDLSSYSLSNLSEGDSWTRENELGAKINFRTPFSVIDGQKGRLRFGVRLRRKDKLRENNYFEYEPVNDLGSLPELPVVYYGGKNFQPGSQYVPGTFVNPSYLGGLDLNNGALFEKEDKPDEYLAENYTAKENIVAGYLRWDQHFSDKLSAVIGVRVENTHINYTGNYVKDEEELLGSISNTNAYTNILPSISFRYEPQQYLVLRAAYTTSLARPNYYNLVPYLNVLSEDEELYAGNPDLKATYAHNFDLMAERYFRSVGILSGGLFYKSLKNFIYTFTRQNYTTENFAADFPGQANPVPAGENNWKFTQQRNGENVNIYGFEVALQRQFDFIPGSFWKGLGIYLNYTFTGSTARGITNEDGEERTDVNLPGTAPHMFNSSLSWENKRFSARVSLNYAASYIDELGGNDFEDRYYDRQLFLDANASYKFTRNFRLFAEANNLTNQPLRYYQGIAVRTMQVEYYRPRFNLGIKFDSFR